MYQNDAKLQYNWIEGTEKLEKYEPGGYHPIMIGDILHERYAIVDKLGFGGYSTIWLAQDTRLKQYVAVKDSVPRLLDEFELTGPNGTHPCYTVAPARCNLRDAVLVGLFPLRVARVLSAGLAQAVAYIHSRGYVHGDIHLRNVLVKLPSTFDHLSVEQLYKEYGEPETVPITHRDGKPLPPNVPEKAVIPLDLSKPAKEFLLSDSHVLLNDFGEAFAPDLTVRRGEDCHTPLAARPPESRFEPQSPLSYSADIWSLAVTIWEILGMKSIFSNDWASADEIVTQQIDTLGPMPGDWWDRWDGRCQFFNKGHTKEGREAWPPIEKAFDEYVQNYRRKHNVGEFDREETVAILDLMRRMLVFRPHERLTAEEILQSEWMVKWALPELEQGISGSP